MAEVERSLGGLDILVNNAGVADVSGGVLHQTEAKWDNTMATHLDATFLLSKLAAASMLTRKRGKIINLASMYSYFGAGALPSYSAAKGAIVQLTKSMAIELAPHNIQVNAIAPGAIEVERYFGFPGYDRDEWGQRIPAGRVGWPSDIGPLAAFLCCEGAGYITGQIIWVDGGMTSRLGGIRA